MAEFSNTGQPPDSQIDRASSSNTKQGDLLNSKRPLKFSNFCVRLISALTLALLVFIALLTVVREGENVEEETIPVLLFLFAAALVVIFFPRPIIAKAIHWLRLQKRILLSATVILFFLGLAARLGFMVFDYVPKSDPEQFFTDATSLLQTGVLTYRSYVGMFPHLYAYSALLAGMFSITGSGLLGIIILNTVFDGVAAFLVGHLIYLFTASRKWQLITSIFWWISPFNIIFCAISLPVIVVNTLILIVLVSLVYLFKSVKNLKRILILSAASSIALAAEDAFRPIAIITIIAIAVYYAVYLLKERNLKFLRNCIFSIMIIAGLGGVFGFGWQQAVNAATGLPTNTNKQGWSIYVGSNYETGGRWNREDDDHLMRVLDEYNGDYAKAFGKLQKEGIARWKLLGPVKATALVVKKFTQFTGNNQNMIYNLSSSYPYWKAHDLQLHAMRVLCAIYWFLMLAFALYLFFRRRRIKKLDFIGFLSILTIGLLLAFMAVEVANRYFTVFFPMFTIFAMLGLKSAVKTLKSHTFL